MISTIAPKVSIIIPTFKDTSNLFNCLKALEHQTYHNFETIVVNNYPHEDLSYLKLKFKNIFIVNESKAGSYAARNCGIKHSTGVVLGFTDSDCVPDKDWIKNATEYFALCNSCAILGGEIKKVFLKNSPNLIELYDSLSFHLQEKYISKYHFAVTANVFIEKQVFTKIGTFDGSIKSGGDSEFGSRAWESGFDISYNPRVIVTHRAISNLPTLLGKMRRVCGGKFQVKNMQTMTFGVFLSTILTNYFRTIFKALKVQDTLPKKNSFSLFLLECLVQTAVLVEYFRLRFGGVVVRSY